jgi:hypothetical protein
LPRWLITLSCPISFLETAFWLKKPQKCLKSDVKTLKSRKILPLSELRQTPGLLLKQAEKGRFQLKNGHTSKLEKIWDKIRLITGRKPGFTEQTHVMTTFFRLLIGVLLGGGLVLGKPVVYAQSGDYYFQLDSARAYWKLKADQWDQKPTVQFFNRHHELLYQEPLLSTQPITKRTKQAFDRLLVQLTTNRLLATAYLADREASFLIPMPTLNEMEALRQLKVKKGVVVFSVDPRVSQTGELSIGVAQQARKQIRLFLEGEDDNLPYFDDATIRPVYRWILKLDQLPDGRYNVRIEYGLSSCMYRLTINRVLNQYVLQHKWGFD